MIQIHANAVIHHVGFACPDIVGAIALHEAFGFTLEGPVMLDPVQKVKVAFLRDARGHCIELLEPSSSDSPVQAIVEDGGGLHHVCYQVADLDSVLKTLRANRFLVVREPVEACALDGKRIAFVWSDTMRLIELVEE